MQGGLARGVALSRDEGRGVSKNNATFYLKNTTVRKNY
jgi:hypothetical protein